MSRLERAGRRVGWVVGEGCAGSSRCHRRSWLMGMEDLVGWRTNEVVGWQGGPKGGMVGWLGEVVLGLRTWW